MKVGITLAVLSLNGLFATSFALANTMVLSDCWDDAQQVAATALKTQLESNDKPETTRIAIIPTGIKATKVFEGIPLTNEYEVTFQSAVYSSGGGPVTQNYTVTTDIQLMHDNDSCDHMNPNTSKAVKIQAVPNQ